MACPSGCINGGGQIKPEQMVTVDDEGVEKKIDARDLLDALEMKIGAMDSERVLFEQTPDPFLDQLINEFTQEYG